MPETPPPPAGASPDASPLERALVTLVAASPQMLPEDIGPAVAEAGAQLGGRDVVVHLVELAQDLLCALPAHEGEDREPLPVDGSRAGHAFANEATVQEPVEGGTRLWVPIMDSAERVGVLEAVVDAVGDQTVRQWELLGGLVGELVVTKSRYGDAISKARRTDELSLAAEMRWSLLPPLTYTSPDMLVTGIVQPAYDVGGDAFDYAVARGCVHIGLFDAMGHGLEASRMANVAVGSYRNSRRLGLDISSAVAVMDETVRTEYGDSRFVTGQLGTLDTESGELALVNAGHPPPVAFHADGSREEVAGARTVPIGIGAAPGEPVVTRLQEGDIVLFHTDGVTEARARHGGLFGDDRLRDLVGALLAERLRPAEVLRRVVEVLRRHELRDDATLLLLGWRTGPSAVPPMAR